MVEAPWYRSAFPATRIGPYKNSESEVEFTARGFRLATSVGGTLTGRGGDIIIIIDDPLKPDDANSEAKRNQANEWFKNTLLSRLDDKRAGAIVIVMQRVHWMTLPALSQASPRSGRFSIFPPSPRPTRTFRFRRRKSTTGGPKSRFRRCTDANIVSEVREFIRPSRA